MDCYHFQRTDLNKFDFIVDMEGEGLNLLGVFVGLNVYADWPFLSTFGNGC